MNILSTLLGGLFPTTCIICNTIGPDICTKCLLGLAPSKPAHHDWIISIWNYHDPNVAAIMKSLKNHPNTRIVKILASSLYKKIISEKNNSLLVSLNQIIIIPIPIHSSRFRERGYNQSELIAQPLGLLLSRRIYSNILYKKIQTKKQGTARSRTERMHNLSNSFGVNNKKLLLGRDVIIIDDITTTGTTLIEARNELLHAGARNVIAITLAN